MSLKNANLGFLGHTLYTGESWPKPNNISGQTYSGVPQNVYDQLPFYIPDLDSPKSAILISPQSEIKRFRVDWWRDQGCNRKITWARYS